MKTSDLWACVAPTKLASVHLRPRPQAFLGPLFLQEPPELQCAGAQLSFPTGECILRRGCTHCHGYRCHLCAKNSQIYACSWVLSVNCAYASTASPGCLSRSLRQATGTIGSLHVTASPRPHTHDFPVSAHVSFTHQTLRPKHKRTPECPHTLQHWHPAALPIKHAQVRVSPPT